MQTELFRDSVVEEIVRCFDGNFEEVSAELKQLEVK